MSIRGRIGKLTVAITAGLIAAPALGVTVQTFDGGGTVFTTAGNNGGALPAVVAGGPTGSFLRVLPDGVGGLLNKVGFNQSDLGAATSLSFDARLPVEATHTGCCGQRADGFGVTFLNTAAHGITGAGPDINERPSINDSFSIGFDIFEGNPGDPNVYTLNRNGVEVAQVAIPLGTLDLNNGLFNRYDVTLAQTNSGTAVTVTVTPDIHGAPGAPVTLFNNVNVAGLSAGGRLAMGGRTGGAVTALDVDNVTANFADLTDKTTHDFDSIGTGFNAIQRGSAPGAAVVAGGPSGSFLRLVNDNVNSQENSIAFDAAKSGISPTKVVANFDFRITSTDQAADGFSMLLIPTATFGTVGTGVAVTGGLAEEPNFAGIIAMGIDIFSNENDASLHFGSELVNIDLSTAAIDLDNGVFHHAELVLEESGGQVLASLVLTPDVFGVAGPAVTAFSNVVIPGLTELYDYRVQFAARTGGLNMAVDLDNIDVGSGAIPEPASALLGVLGLGALALRRRREA